MSLQQGQCTSFKMELMQGLHNFNTDGNTFKIALYTADANLTPDITTYTSVGEVLGTNYTAGGIALTNIAPNFSGTTAFISFNNAVFVNVTLVTRGALIYNATNGNRAVCVLNFGLDVTKIASDLIINFPIPSATSAIIRIV